MTNEEFKALMVVAANWNKIQPTGVYPWHAKKQYKSVKMGEHIGLEEIEQPEFEDKVTKFIPITDVETPDPNMIHAGEVAGYINALSPVILTKNKNEQGQWIIEDGRHRVAAWRASGYRVLPVVFKK